MNQLGIFDMVSPASPAQYLLGAREVLFELRDGSQRLVDLAGALPADLYLATLVKELVSEKKSQVRWWLASALHKEIRRGDVVKAQRFARWLDAIRGKLASKKYCEGIILEETRNLNIMFGTKWGCSETAVKALATSRKKWAIPEIHGNYLMMMPPA